MKVRVENGLPENSMFPKNRRSINLAEKPLYFVFERKEFCIKFGRHITITCEVLFGDNEQMSLGKRSIIGNDAKQGCLFKNIGANVLVLAECAAGTVCFSIQGDATPVLHAGDSFLSYPA